MFINIASLIENTSILNTVNNPIYKVNYSNLRIFLYTKRELLDFTSSTKRIMTVSISPYDLTEQIDIHLFGDLAIDFLGDRERNKVHKHMQA